MGRALRTVVIGAGVGGLTAAALLLKAGHEVTVLEAHIYPGGSAGTFYHQKYMFDAGATLAGGFAPGGPHAKVAEILGLEWPIRAVDPAWIVHLPDGRVVTQWVDRSAWEDERKRLFPNTEHFWHLQERLAKISWDIASRPFPWPPQSPANWLTLARGLRPSTLPAIPYLARTMNSLPLGNDPLFRTFLDAQLLISAQTTTERAGALYGSAALDLPRRGVNHVLGGIGSLAKTLVEWIRANGGQVHFRQRVERIEVSGGRAKAVYTVQGARHRADFVLANVTPWKLNDLLGAEAPGALASELENLEPTWGAFTLYLGLEGAAIPEGLADHHQIVVDPARPLGEGNSVFLSLSDANDPLRAPPGRRAATLSTHTRVQTWWELYQAANKDGYFQRRSLYADRLVEAAARVVPDLRSAIHLCLPGTPVTFEYYTRRPMGMVGGFPQSSLFAARGPRVGFANLWLVGDSIFPGQSTAGVTLGALRVAAEVAAAGRRLTRHVHTATLANHEVTTHE